VAAELEIPLIIGWDAAPSGVIYKLYANASDRAVGERIRLARHFDLAGGESDEVPQIIGLNVSKRKTELKAYYPHPKPPDIGFPRVALAPEAVVSWLVSCEVSRGTATPRALFAAISDSRRHEAELLVTSVTGSPWSTLAERFPFEPGPIRQIGWGRDGSLTVYAKAAGAARALHVLEPSAVFTAPGFEVGLYLEPSAGTARAFTRTARHALSFRTRLGEPSSAAVERLGEWAKGRVLQAERSGEPPRFDAPPDPWKLSCR
jgi:hypothetical protein